jgi:hypothetical protein
MGEADRGVSSRVYKKMRASSPAKSLSTVHSPKDAEGLAHLRTSAFGISNSRSAESV